MHFARSEPTSLAQQFQGVALAALARCCPGVRVFDFIDRSFAALRTVAIALRVFKGGDASIVRINKMLRL
jgi:hypothetical protein